MTAPIEDSVTDTTGVVEDINSDLTDSEGVVESIDSDSAEGEDTADLTAFKAAIEELLSRGFTAEDKLLMRPVRKEYQALDREAKTEARKLVDADAKASILKGEFERAQGLTLLRDDMVKPMPQGAGRAPAKPKDPTAETVALIASLTLAYSMAQVEAQRNPELAPDWQARVDAEATNDGQSRAMEYANWLRNKQEGDEPEATDIQKAAARISLGRAPKGQGRKPKIEDAATATPATPVGAAQ